MLIEASGVSSVGAPGGISGGGGGGASSASSKSSTSSTRVSAAAPEGHDAASMAFLGWTQACLSALPERQQAQLRAVRRYLCSVCLQPSTVIIAGSLNVRVTIVVKATGRPV